MNSLPNFQRNRIERHIIQEVSNLKFHNVYNHKEGIQVHLKGDLPKNLEEICNLSQYDIVVHFYKSGNIVFALYDYTKDAHSFLTFESRLSDIIYEFAFELLMTEVTRFYLSLRTEKPPSHVFPASSTLLWFYPKSDTSPLFL